MPTDHQSLYKAFYFSNWLPLLVAPALFTSCQTAHPERASHLSTYNGMTEERNGLVNKALVREVAKPQIARYDKVTINKVKVLTSTSPEDGGASRQDTEEIAVEFEGILAEELGQNFTITREPGESTLLVRAALTEVSPGNPAMFAVNYLPYASLASAGVGIARKKTVGAGSTAVEIEVVDSIGGEQKFAMIDQIKGNRLMLSGLSKWGHSNSALRKWAQRVREGLTE